MNKKLENIVTKLQSELPKIKSQYNVTKLEIFGSYVRNEETPKSDLDILVTFSKAPSLFTFIELEEYLSETLGVNVDLVMKNSLKPNIGKKILSEARAIL